MNDLEDRARDHDVPAPRGGPRLQLRLRALQDARVARPVRPVPAPLPRPLPARCPFSRRFVRHIAGWYAQKHPDEDFAETFAVWLTPRSQWRKRYTGWGAMAKLRYVDRMARRLRDVEPVRPQGHTDITVEEMETTVEEFYQQGARGAERSRSTSRSTRDLVDIFPVSKRKKKGARPAADLLRENRKALDRQGHLLDGRAAPARQAPGRVDRDARRGARPARRGARARRST